MAGPPPPASEYAFPHPGPPPEHPELPEGVPEPPPRWAPWTAPVSLIAGFAVAVFGYLVIGTIAGAAGANVNDLPPGVEIGATVVQDLALIGSALLFARMAARPRARQFGLRPTRFWPATGWLLAAWFGFFVFTVVWVAALGIKERDDLPKQLGVDESTLALIAVALLVTVVAPIAEEFFFRGYFFTALRNWKGVWPAAILTGLVFGGIHAGSAPVGYLVPLAAFGIALCLLYWRTGSLYPCIVLHSLNNSLALGVSQGWSWQVPAVMLAANGVIALIMLAVGDRAPAPARLPGRYVG
jgi:membrane protease YdiL (CAAX protease family)